MSDDLISDDSAEVDDLDDWAAEHEQRIAECARLIMQCHARVVEKIGDVEEMLKSLRKALQSRA